MLTEQAIAVVVILVLLAIAVAGFVISSREGDRLERRQQANGGMRDNSVQ